MLAVVLSPPDQTAPTITLLGPTQIFIEAFVQLYVEPGYTAVDISSGTITSNVSVSQQPNAFVLGVYNLVYTVKDAAGNSATPQTRVVIVRDTTAPTLVLNGDAVITLEFQTAFVDPGAAATDLVDGVLTTSITVANLSLLAINAQVVNQAVILVYTVNDSSGNTVNATRIVRIVASSTDHEGPIAGGVAGSVVAIAVLLAALIVWLRRRQIKTAPKNEQMLIESTVGKSHISFAN
jgi:hypothetical protein